MRKKNNNMICIILPSVALLCAGCTVERPLESLLPTPSGTAAGRADSPGRFQDTDPAQHSAVESAMELSAKYAKLIEEMTALKADNEKLAKENQILKDQLAPCHNNLTQAQNELAEANDLLIEMRIELNNWKSNVLGFRDELRNAENAQLDALVKILEVLGGQAKADLTPDLKPTNSLDDPNHPQPAFQAGTAPGLSNG
ncbi:MAG: hypothetical protein JXN61_17270 [Sedimentisphaerales bacterium]|nr:hypothetical protein [Sedimentisphaerales bacterium]